MLRRIAAIGGAARDIDEATAALCAKMEDGETAEFGRGRKVDPHRPLPRGNPVVMTLVDRRGLEDAGVVDQHIDMAARSEEHTSALKSLMRYSYDVFCLTKKTY